MRQIPAGRWGTVWVCTAIVVVAAIAGLEGFVRRRGYVPSIKDDDYAWALERQRAADHSGHTVAILGTSRILLAFSDDAFRSALPGWRYVQLAKQGSQPIASFRDLALDPDFRGVAVVDCPENGFDAWNWTDQAQLVETYRRGWRNAGQLAERWLSTQVQSRVALLANDGMRTLRSLASHGTWPKPPYTTTHADRTRFADYSLTDVGLKRAAQLARIEGIGVVEEANADAWLADALAQELYVVMIKARGGDVVFIRMPTCDERWRVDESRYPKARFWDRFARFTHAHTIHFRDYPTLAHLDCPDTSHVASKDGPVFTRSVIAILERMGVIAR